GFTGNNSGRRGQQRNNTSLNAVTIFSTRQAPPEP
ncbi:unnamed protein product, partial [Allacma fusca]